MWYNRVHITKVFNVLYYNSIHLQNFKISFHFPSIKIKYICHLMTIEESSSSGIHNQMLKIRIFQNFILTK